MCTAIVPLAQTVHFYTVSLVILSRPHASKPQSLCCDGSVAEPTKSNYKSCYKRWELPNLCLIHRSKSQGTRFTSSFPDSLREVAYGVCCIFYEYSDFSIMDIDYCTFSLMHMNCSYTYVLIIQQHDWFCPFWGSTCTGGRGGRKVFKSHSGTGTLIS